VKRKRYRLKGKTPEEINATGMKKIENIMIPNSAILLRNEHLFKFKQTVGSKANFHDKQKCRTKVNFCCTGAGIEIMIQHALARHSPV